jgi:SAM-dependent methyltransferase
MGISINGARFLAYSVAGGLKMGRTTVVGRQGLFAPPRLLRALFQRHGLTVSPESEDFFREEKVEWADALFRALGANPLEFMDASAYEGATRLHDLNVPLSPDWEETSDTLIDSGSLEHVFDAKTAIESYLRLVRVGGSVVLLDMPAVNFCGHGFYQFSPEFFCEVFSERHGFELQSLALAAEWGYAPFYSVSHPRAVGGRVEIPSTDACHLFVRARKIRPFRGFERPIAQSDYEMAWDKPKAPPSVPRAGFSKVVGDVWRRIDPEGHWRFSTRRDRQRSLRANAVHRGRYVSPLDI